MWVMYTELKMGIKRIVICNDKLNLSKQVYQEKKCKYKNQKMENEQEEEEMNSGEKKILGIDEI